MKKVKLYDFSLSTALMVLVAYIIVFIFTTYYNLNSEGSHVFGFVIEAFLLFSFIFLVIYYIVLAITVLEDQVSYHKIVIKKENLRIYSRRNYRLKYDEIIFRDKTIDYKKLDRKEIKKHEFAVQQLKKHEVFLLAYLNIDQIKSLEY